ncbi:MAG: DUF2330 domain-containing protein [Ktedonobacterales bacterium]|nr:DUF2330 domain-containing protein [Ktedonobacterales bacterium]
MRRCATKWLPLVLAVGILALPAGPALACGSLLSPNGTIHLARAATLVAWHGGIEHYMTSFTYAGDEANLGWIVPLPANPDKIEEGGGWTLQRLVREVNPIAPGVFNATAAEGDATVLQQVQVAALNISVIQGSGNEIIKWVTSNGFALDADTRAHLLLYAKASPIFMAVKFDTSEVQKRHETTGDGTPLLLTMHTTHPWVPLEVLALDGQTVHADLFFLTDRPLNVSDLAATVGQNPVGSTVGGASGFTVAYQAQMNPTLYHDLSTDRNMSWVRSDSWLTYLKLDAPAEKVTFDLGITDRGVIRLATLGTAPMSIGDAVAAHSYPAWVPQLPIGAPLVLLLIVLGAAVWVGVIVFIRRSNRATNPVEVAE